MAAILPAQIALLSVACFVGGAVGAFATSMMSPSSKGRADLAEAAQPVGSAPRDAELLGEVRALREDLARAMEARSRVEPGALDRVGSGSNEVLVQQLRALIESSKSATGGGVDSGSSEADLVRQPVANALGSLRTTVGTFDAAGSDFVEKITAAERRLTDGHLLWTLHDVVEHYGKPEQVAGGGGEISLHYVYGDPRMEFRFRFVDGFVIDASIEGGY